MTRDQFVSKFNKFSTTQIPEDLLKELFMTLCSLPQGDNKQIVSFIQAHLTSKNHRLPTQLLYEILSKMAGHPSWNVAKVQKVYFKGLFTFMELFEFMPIKKIQTPYPELNLSLKNLSPNASTLLLSSDSDLVRTEMVEWSKNFINHGLKVFHFNYRNEPSLLLKEYGNVLRNPKLSLHRPESYELSRMEKDLRDWYSMEAFDVLILDSLEDFVSLGGSYEKLEERIQALTRWAKLFNVHLVAPCTIRSRRELTDSIPLEVSRNFTKIILVEKEESLTNLKIYKN